MAPGASPGVTLLLLVADLIDGAGPVIRHEDGAILRDDDVVRSAVKVLRTFQPAGGELLLFGVLAVGIGDDAHDARALVIVPVPRAVLGDENVVLILSGELIA